MSNQVGAFERHLEKEPERDDRAIDAWSGDIVPRHMQLKKAIYYLTNPRLWVKVCRSDSATGAYLKRECGHDLSPVIII